MSTPTPAARSAEHKVRHFRNMVLGIAALFVATQVAAFSGLVPHLSPVSFQEVTANILFAIGFGCPLVLHLSSLPPWRELLATVVLGALLAVGLWGLQLLLGIPPEFAPMEVAVAQAITGLGLASLGVLGWRAWRNHGWERTQALIFLLPGCVALIYAVEAGIFLYFIKAIFTTTFDANAYAADEAYGLQISFALGRLFTEMPWLKYVCFAIYVAPPPALIFVYALQTRARRPPPVDVVTALLVLALVGYGLYFLCPVSGPIYIFGSELFPYAPPSIDLIGQRLPVPTRNDSWPNAMPSLHLASVLLAYWHAKPFGWIARAAAAVFVVGTFLATLGLGEHYFIDLVVAVPFTLAVHAGCQLFVSATASNSPLPLYSGGEGLGVRGNSPRNPLTPGPSPPSTGERGVALPAQQSIARPLVRPAALAAFLGASGLVALWYGLLFKGLSILLASPWVAWGLTGATVALVVVLEWRLFRAMQRDAKSSEQTPIAPGPRGHWLLGNLQEFRRDVLGLLLNARRDHGDVVRFRLGPKIVHLVSHPDHIKQVLVTHHHLYDKNTRSSAKIRLITGEGLLTGSGAFWLQQRRLVQPAFHAQRMATFVENMTSATAAMIERWRIIAKQGQSLDVASEMMRLTCTIVATALFGADVTSDLGELEDAVTLVMEQTWRRLETLVDQPPWAPTPRNRRFRQALGKIDAIVNRIIDSRRNSSTPHKDLLALLLRERDAETGRGMSAASVRNETITLLLAGHETTANALTWVWYLLARHPEAAQRVRAEVDQVLGQRTPTIQDLPQLKYTLMVIQEAMRLYPPIWIMERRVLDDDMIGGYAIPAGSTVVLAPWVTHRHPDFWENAEGFDPERFLPERSTNRPAHAYFPFGAGQRLCVGNVFALTEAQIIVAMVAQAFRLDLQPGFVATPKPGITLRSEGGLPMTPMLIE